MLDDMFSVQFTADAKALLAERFLQSDFAQPGVTIHRKGPQANITRTNSGEAKWEIERPHPWGVLVGDFESFGENPEDVFVFDGIRVWLAVIPKPGEVGVQVSVREGELYVEPICGV